MSTDANKSPSYDAVIVLGMNIRKIEAGYRPTTYHDYDEFGMLAGEMNIIAASLLFEQQQASTFVFSTGTSQKTKAAFGPDAPTEASVYSQDFLKRISGTKHPRPTIILEDRSVNTYSNLTECIDIIASEGWRNIAIMSARYHIPRVEMLWQLATKSNPVATRARFLVAEDVISANLPGIYDEMITAAYHSAEGKKRLQSEAQGLQDMKDGKYVVTEFQFHQANR